MSDRINQGGPCREHGLILAAATSSAVFIN
jgi:hypothetical protein